MDFYTITGQPLSHDSDFEEKPYLDKQLVKVNDKCLLLTSHVFDQSIIMGWFFVWIFWIIVFHDIAYHFYTSIDSTNNFSDIIFINPGITIAKIIFLLLITVFIAWLTARNISKSCHYCFDRKYSKIYAIVKEELYEADWFSVKAEMTSQTRMYGPNFVTMDIIRILLTSKDDPKKSIIATISASEGSTEFGNGSKMAWTFIQKFMSNGPNTLAINSSSELNNDMSNGKLSYNLSEFLSYRSFLPIYHKSDQKDVIIKDIVFWPFKIIFYIPNILTDIVWNKIISITCKQTNCGYDCGNEWITPNIIYQLLEKNESSLTYFEALKRRINK